MNAMTLARTGSPARDFQISVFDRFTSDDQLSTATHVDVSAVLRLLKLGQQGVPQTVDHSTPEVAKFAGASLAPSADADVGGLKQASLHAAIRRRLRALLKFALNDGDALPDGTLMQGLAGFVASRDALPEPLLTTDRSGILVATWRKSQEEILSIKFKDDERIEFAWAHRNENGKLERDWGDAKWRTFAPSFRYAHAFFGGGE